MSNIQIKLWFARQHMKLLMDMMMSRTNSSSELQLIKSAFFLLAFLGFKLNAYNCEFRMIFFQTVSLLAQLTLLLFKFLFNLSLSYPPRFTFSNAHQSYLILSYLILFIKVKNRLIIIIIQTLNSYKIIKQTDKDMSSELIPTPEPQNSFFNNLKQKLNWKSSLIILLSAFIVYPRPFLFILNPLIKRVRNSYKRNSPKLEKIILSTNRNADADKICKAKLYNNPHHIYIVNLFEEHSFGTRSLQKSLSSVEKFDETGNTALRTENALLRIKMLTYQLKSQKEQNFAILVKGNPDLLHVLEAKLYEMDPNEYYKIPRFIDQDEFHILELGSGTTYEQVIKKVHI